MQPTDDQLNNLLKRAQVPDRDPGYWEHFPARVTAQLGSSSPLSPLEGGALRSQSFCHRRPLEGGDLAAEASDAKERLRRLWSIASGRPVLAFLTTTAVALLIASAAVWRTRETREPSASLPDPAKIYHEMAALFPDRLEAIIADAHGIRVVLADTPRKPSSPPFYVKACARNGCSEIITFSGQQIQINGDTWDILVTGQDKLIVAGPSTDKYHIESRRLGGVS